MSNYTCFDGFICSSLYGKSIRGGRDLVAMACSIDPNCKAFRHNPKTKLGFLCKSSDVKHTSKIDGYNEDEWKLCVIDSGKCIKDIILNILRI